MRIVDEELSLDIRAPFCGKSLPEPLEEAYRTYLAWPAQASQSRLERGGRSIEVQQERDALLLHAVELLH